MKQYERAGAHQQQVRQAAAARGAPLADLGDFERIDTLDAVEALLSQLSPRHRETLEQLYLHGKTQMSVAAARGCGQPAVSQIVQRALRKLRVILSREEDDHTP